MDPDDYPPVCVSAQVSVAIPSGDVGEVTFVTADNARREPAGALLDGRPVEQGAAVVIARWDRGIAVVETTGGVRRPATESWLKPQTRPTRPARSACG